LRNAATDILLLGILNAISGTVQTYLRTASPIVEAVNIPFNQITIP
jgi:hypothetical protein